MRKLLVWDGDETLWNGTILDGDEPLIPAPRLELCNSLAGRGVLQSVASRNSMKDVLAVLHRYDLDNIFLSPQADLLRPKSVMIQGIMSELGLTRQEDVAFADDLPYNLAEVRFSLPGVLTLLPGELDQVVSEHFTKPSYTDEDRLRVRRYRDEDVRRQASSAFGGNRTEFLRTCGLKLEVKICEEEDFPRALDLIRRANRMSSLAKTFSEQELIELMPSLYVGRVSDKYGDYGLSALAVLHLGEIHAMVVSCRLQGKGIGSALLGWLINRRPLQQIRARWVDTPHNGAMRELYKWYSFVQEDPDGSGTIRYWKYVDAAVTLPDWVEVAEHGNCH